MAKQKLKVNKSEEIRKLLHANPNLTPQEIVAILAEKGISIGDPKSIAIELTNKEALVLFEFLRRLDDEGNYSFADQAEERVLWTIEGILEKQLVEILSPEYNRLLKEAREQVRDSERGTPCNSPSSTASLPPAGLL